MPTPHHPPLAVVRSLKKLGLDIKDARRRRGLPAEVVAQRAFTSRPTLRRIEAGDPSVSIGIYVAVLNALGFIDGVAKLADPAADAEGIALAAERLPQRARLKRPRGRGDA